MVLLIGWRIHRTAFPRPLIFRKSSVEFSNSYRLHSSRSGAMKRSSRTLIIADIDSSRELLLCSREKIWPPRSFVSYAFQSGAANPNSTFSRSNQVKQHSFQGIRGDSIEAIQSRRSNQVNVPKTSKETVLGVTSIAPKRLQMSSQ